ncbi:uncharacterized protein LOC126195602 [Schistocerca nitens]|uniref:uncharacterized protein LOC126195602 n=1 Tax=Schistocerca nitens TaxID=7011 RepID=UPI002118B3F2|nr:uncharacterized protein LOC126195602 [Schistocerca nitens]
MKHTGSTSDYASGSSNSSSSSSSEWAHVDEVPVPDYIHPELEALDWQLEMRRCRCYSNLTTYSVPKSAHRERCVEEGIQGGGQMASTAGDTQITEFLEEEEELDLPDWFGGLIECGNELLKPWSQSREGISHSIARVPRAVVAGVVTRGTQPQTHVVPCVAPVRAARDAAAEARQHRPPRRPSPSGVPGQLNRWATKKKKNNGLPSQCFYFLSVGSVGDMFNVFTGTSRQITCRWVSSSMHPLILVTFCT